MIAEGVIKRIAKLYGVEKEVRGQRPDQRVNTRQCKSKPIFDDLKAWLHTQLTRVICYALTRIKKLRPWFDHGFLELDNYAAEQSMRPIALGQKNYLFMGTESGGKSAAIAYTLIETAKLNGIDPQARPTDPLSHIADHKINKIDELLPWRYAETSA